jgi:hypothetical protein
MHHPISLKLFLLKISMLRTVYWRSIFCTETIWLALRLQGMQRSSCRGLPGHRGGFRKNFIWSNSTSWKALWWAHHWQVDLLCAKMQDCNKHTIRKNHKGVHSQMSNISWYFYWQFTKIFNHNLFELIRKYLFFLFLQGDRMAFCSSWRPLNIIEICRFRSTGCSNVTQGPNI